jgi:carbonic anhydrase
MIKSVLKLSVAPALVLLFLCACQSPEQSKNAETDHQNHEMEKGDAYLLPGLDHGLLQSPINILSEEAGNGKHSIALNFNGEVNKIENLGHTVQLDLAPGNTISMDGKTFEFKRS